MNPDLLLREMFAAAVAAADPAQVLQSCLPSDRTGSALVVGAGKAAASMAAALDDAWSGPLRGLVITRYGHVMACDHIEVVEA